VAAGIAAAFVVSGEGSSSSDLERVRQTVTRELIHQGLVAGRIETIAMGATHPVAAGKDKQSKAKNRRVEIAVVH